MKEDSKWRTVVFGDVVRLEQGLCFNKKTNHLMAVRGIPLLRIADLVNDTQTKFVDAERVPKKFIAHPQDIIYTRTGQVGLVFTGRVGVVHNNCFRIIPQEGIERAYIYWYLRQPSVIERARALAGGAAQPDLGHDAFKSIPFRYPNQEGQRRIAGMLSAYDELIKNSRRRIELLETMARDFYREWFVHFHFPGHENVSRVTSPLGDIPQGWEVRRIDEALRFDSGRTIKKEERENGDTPVYGANGIIGGTANSPMAHQCIIMGKIGSCGSLHRSLKPCWVTNNAFLIQPAAIQSLELAWQVLMDVDFRQYVGGAANPYMPINSFGQHEVLIAPAELQAEFEKRVGQLRRLVETLTERTANLRRAQDLLLPRLMSGRVELRKAETDVEA